MQKFALRSAKLESLTPEMQMFDITGKCAHARVGAIDGNCVIFLELAYPTEQFKVDLSVYLWKKIFSQ